MAGGTVNRPPPKATILSARRISSRGGQTQFASTKAAYEHLADDDQEFLKNLSSIHTVTAAVREFFRPEDLDAARRALRQEHPLIWTRMDGTRSMLIGYSADPCAGLSLADGRSSPEERWVGEGWVSMCRLSVASCS